jgi:putative autotransporter adhesin-like protein
MRKSIAAAVIAASTAIAGCGQVHAENGGPTVSRSYKVGDFQKLEVAGPYDVEVRTGAQPGVSARGSQKLLERTTVEVKGDKLVIHPEQRKGWFHMGWSSHGNAHFIVTVPQLRAATIAGSGGIKVDQVRGDSFEGTVAGSGDLDVASADVQWLKLTIAGSGAAKAGGGKAQNAEYEIAGSGDVDAGAVQAQQAKVSIAGSGSIKARATGTADVSIMGSGDVDVTGGAKCSVSKAGSGNVRCS